MIKVNFNNNVVSGNAFGGTTLGVTITGCSAGSQLIVAFSYEGSSGSVALAPPTLSWFTLTGGGTIVQDQAGTTGGTSGTYCAVGLFRVTGAGSGSRTVTINPAWSDSPWYMGMTLLEVSAITLDQAPSMAQGTGQRLVAGPTGALSVCGELAVCAWCEDSTTPGALNLPGGTWNTYPPIVPSGSAAPGILLGTQIIPTIGPVSAIGTTAGSTPTSYSGVLCTYIDATAPSFITPPQNQTVAMGAAATFSLSAQASSGSLTYQWYTATPSPNYPPVAPGLYSASPGAWSAISGATSLSYTTPNLSAYQTGTWYYCAVTDSNGTTNSPPVRAFVSGLGPDARGLQ